MVLINKKLNNKPNFKDFIDWTKHDAS
jgi:hypothetical protein